MLNVQTYVRNAASGLSPEMRNEWEDTLMEAMPEYILDFKRLFTIPMIV